MKWCKYLAGMKFVDFEEEYTKWRKYLYSSESLSTLFNKKREEVSTYSPDYIADENRR